MSIVVIGVTHRASPVSLLERLTIAPAELSKAVVDLVARDNIREAVVLSTCNRTEIYAVVERFHAAYGEIRDFLCSLGDLAVDELLPHLFSQHDEAAVEHLFDVVSGLDSVVLGESEILGQVRQAWQTAQSEQATRSTLNLLFRTALEVGKRVRTETAIGRGTASVSHAAVEMASDELGSLRDRKVLVIGAGAIGEGIAVALHAAGAAEIVVANRTVERGDALAERFAGRSVGFERIAEELGTCDVMLTSALTEDPIITAELVSLARQPMRPLLVVDVAVPRNVDAAVAELDAVTVLDLDDLRRWAERGREQRRTEIDHVRSIITESVDRFDVQATALQAAPLVAALRERAEEIRVAELERYRHQLADNDPATRELVDAITKGILAKLLHEPSVRLRDQAGSPRGERNAAAVSDLFDLG